MTRSSAPGSLKVSHAAHVRAARAAPVAAQERRHLRPEHTHAPVFDNADTLRRVGAREREIGRENLIRGREREREASSESGIGAVLSDGSRVAADDHELSARGDGVEEHLHPDVERVAKRARRPPRHVEILPWSRPDRSLSRRDSTLATRFLRFRFSRCGLVVRLSPLCAVSFAWFWFAGAFTAAVSPFADRLRRAFRAVVEVIMHLAPREPRSSRVAAVPGGVVVVPRHFRERATKRAPSENCKSLNKSIAYL